MQVIATAGHVDHGKSALVRALTGMEPDRWAEEQRRGMTLDLGFAWTTLPSGETVAFVDVPGHERFLTTMMAGVGPVPAVLVVVAADEGWRAQKSEHVTVLDSLGIRHGLLVVSRSDLADPAPVLTESRMRLARTSLGEVEAVAVSAVTGEGLAQLCAALDRLVASLPLPARGGRVRLFVDRAFTVRGSGTVVTGTLGSGTLYERDRLVLAPTNTAVRVRGLQSLGQPMPEVPAVARVAVNLRGIPVAKVRRGHALLTPTAWISTAAVDVRLLALDPADLRGDLVFHVGSAAVACHVRPLGEEAARVRLAHPLPLQPGDRAVLREPSSRLATGLIVLDVDPPLLRRRGAARIRGLELASASGVPDPVAEVARRGSMTRAELAERGILAVDRAAPEGLIAVQDRLVDPATWKRWGEALAAAVDAHRASSPLHPALPVDAARTILQLPDVELVMALVRDSGGALISNGGRIGRPGSGPAFSSAQQRALDDLCRRLERDPLDAPQAHELANSGLTREILAAAQAAGLVLRLPGEVILRPSAADHAMSIIRGIKQPFTLSEARQALGTTRKVAVPLLEHLDALRLTIRIDSNRRRIRE